MGSMYGTAQEVKHVASPMSSGTMAIAYDAVPVRSHAIDVTDGVVPDNAICGWIITQSLASTLDWFSISSFARCRDCAVVLNVAIGVEK